MKKLFVLTKCCPFYEVIFYEKYIIREKWSFYGEVSRVIKFLELFNCTTIDKDILKNSQIKNNHLKVYQGDLVVDIKF